jgi:hypothetical protein
MASKLFQNDMSPKMQTNQTYNIEGKKVVAEDGANQKDPPNWKYQVKNLKL